MNERQDDPMLSEVNDFDLDRSTAEAWAGFTGRLAEVISVMEPAASLTIGSMATESEGQSPFVSFRCADDRSIHAEATGNAALSEQFQLEAEQLQAMEEIGWRPANVDEMHPTPNFWCHGVQEESDGLAEKAVRALRDVYGVPHPVFLAPDQLAEVLTPSPSQEAPLTEYDAEDVVATIPTNRDHLNQLVESELTQLFGHPPLRDADGDFAIRVGSTMVFIRSTTDAREVLVFSALVHEVEGRSRAMEVMSDLNTEARYVRFMLIRDRVFVSLSVFAHPFVPAHLHQALKVVSVVADEIDEHLATKLRGRTTFSEGE